MNKELLKYDGLAKFLGSTIAETFEIILFDLTKEEYEIITHINKADGTINGAKELIKGALDNEKAMENGFIANQFLASEDESMVKSSIYFIKEDDKNIGALCLNMQCGIYMKIHNLVSGLLGFDGIQMGNAPVSTEYTEPIYEEVNLDTISKVIDEEIEDPERSKPSERVEAIVELYDLGVFEIKGSVARAAKELKVSEKSIYRYICKIKKARKY